MTGVPEVGRSTTRRARVLFVAEAVTLAHVARPSVLARSLDPAVYEVCLACAPRYNKVLGSLPFAQRPVHSVPSERFLAALASGSPLYDADTLRGYVKEDLEVIREFSPDVVVGDFRLSLAVSARLAGVPYLTISNAYWSPYARLRFPMPDLPLARRLGIPLARLVFRLVRPAAFAYHTLPLNRVRREHGQPSLGLDLRRVYTEADHVLYADVPELIPTFNLPPNHQYLGPILWSPTVPRPAWWEQVPRDRPVVYVTLGSSGQSAALGTVLEALAGLPLAVMAATAGRVDLKNVPANAYVADYLPGEEAAARAQVVICNGGSPTTQQALAVGTPVLGIATNMDQYLNMEAVQREGAGLLLRAGTADAAAVREAVQTLLGRPAFAAAASRMARVFANYPAATRFQEVLARVTTGSPPGSQPTPAGSTPSGDHGR